MEIIEAVKHYQRSIERCPGNEERMLHCITKLYHLPVTVQHLQETGVGRTVNALRKYVGDAGDAAKALVAKWKAMVAAEEFGDGENAEENNVETAPDSTEDHHHHKTSREHHHKSNQESHHRSSDREQEHISRKHRDEVKSNHHKPSTSSKQSHKRKSNDSSMDRRSDEKRRRSNVSESNSDDDDDDDDDDDEEEDDSDSGEMQIEEQNSEENDEEEDRDSGTMMEDSQESQDSSASSSEQISHSKHHHSQSSSHHHDSHRKHEKHKDRSHSEDKRHSKKSDSSSTKKSEGSSNGGNSSKGEKVRNKCESEEYRKVESSSKHKKSDGEKHNNKRDSSSDKHRNDSSSDKHRKENSDKYKKEEKVKVEIKKEPKEHRHEKSSKSKSETHNEHIPPKHEVKESSSKSSSSSKSKSSASKSNDSKESRENKKTKKSDAGEDGSIDCFSGASFAEALGMVDPVVKKKQSPAVSSSSHRSSSSKRNDGSSSSEKKSREPSTSKSSKSSIDLSLLTSSVKLEPLDFVDVDIDSTLPAITPNYKPLPHLPLDALKERKGRMLTEEEALSQVMSTKNQRTKVYSGVKSGKSWTSVPSLYDICVRVLQENIDALEYTGGVPYDLLKPVLAQATPEQLSNLEYYNPYLIEDTNELWELHCKKQFRNKEREDMETSREMYMRCVEEREAKLKALTTNIQQSIIAKTTPIRKTKLAYVECDAKPPRNVKRQQEKYGTAKAANFSPVKAAKPNSSGASVPVPIPRVSHAVPKVKPRMAPLMQKTMKFAKSFKR